MKQPCPHHKPATVPYHDEHPEPPKAWSNANAPTAFARFFGASSGRGGERGFVLSKVAVYLLHNTMLNANKIAQFCATQYNAPLCPTDGAVNIVYIEGMNPDGTENADRIDEWNDLFACWLVWSKAIGKYCSRRLRQPSRADSTHKTH